MSPLQGVTRPSSTEEKQEMLEWLAEVGYLPCLERKMWVHTSAAEPNMRRDRLGKEKLQRVVKSAPRKKRKVEAMTSRHGKVVHRVNSSSDDDNDRSSEDETYMPPRKRRSEVQKQKRGRRRSVAAK